MEGFFAATVKMSVSRPARCISELAKAGRGSQRRCLHNSPYRSAGSPPKERNLKAPSTNLTQSRPERLTAADFPRYTEAEKAALRHKYTPAQIAAIEAGEEAIDPNDLAEQAAVRNDPMSLRYFDDFATIRPVIDKPVRAPESNYDPDIRYKDEDELAEDLANWIQNLPEDADRAEWMKFAETTRMTVGKEEAERNPHSYAATELPKLTDPITRSVVRAAADGEDSDANAHWIRLSKQTGMDVKRLKRLRVKVLVTHYVTNQTRLGKIQSLYYLTVAGNERGLLGIGEGKSAEPEDGRRQSAMNAIKNMVPVKRYEERTIYGDVKGKVGATELELMTRPPGRCPSICPVLGFLSCSQ